MSNFKVTNENFADLLLESVEEAHEHARGKITLKTEMLSLLTRPPKYSKAKIKKIRKKLNVSQSIFSKILNISVTTVRSWELGTNQPSGATERLLEILENDPAYLMKAITKKKSA